MRIPDFHDVAAAAERLAGVVVETPVLRSAALDQATGARVFVKPECLQVSGSFKFRGACNRLCRLSAAEHKAGVVAWSSGNHAQGVAAAARRLRIQATIVMPEDAPRIKIDNTRRLGAEIVFYDRLRESREDIARALAAERNCVLVPSYDDPYVIAGQGSLGVELVRQLAAVDVQLDALLVCCGGGGLIAGTALAFAELSPHTELYAVEPAGFDDHARSLAAGRRVRNEPGTATLCDALLAPEPGEITWEINRRHLAGGLVVDDGEVLDAMRFALRELKLVAEPGGAVALAAILSGKLPVRGKRVGVIISGGNVDEAILAQALERH